jgi:membrane associated rhomboid family serine protease
MGQGGKRAFFESPHAVTYTLILLNSAAFGLCLLGNSLVRIDPATLLHYGALYQDALTRKEYWRLVAYAFLHANVLHFGLNMLCIAAWSGLLEQRLGATYFIVVYLASAIGGGIASVFGHPRRWRFGSDLGHCRRTPMPDAPGQTSAFASLPRFTRRPYAGRLQASELVQPRESSRA